MDESRAHVELYHQAGFYKTPMAYPRNKKKHCQVARNNEDVLLMGVRGT
jgi:hypothetical protein